MTIPMMMPVILTTLFIRLMDALRIVDEVYMLTGGGPGILEAVPRHVEVPSRGVVERELLHRLAGNLFSAEEVLFLLGEPGAD